MEACGVALDIVYRDHVCVFGQGVSDPRIRLWEVGCLGRGLVLFAR